MKKNIKKEKALKLLEKGMSVKKVALKLGVSIPAVYVWKRSDKKKSVKRIKKSGGPIVNPYTFFNHYKK